MEIFKTEEEVREICGFVPTDTYQALKRYVEDGIEPGGFLMACLTNDFSYAVARADANNTRCLKAISLMIHWAIPHKAHGSTQRVDEWLKGGYKDV